MASPTTSSISNPSIAPPTAAPRCSAPPSCTSFPVSPKPTSWPPSPSPAPPSLASSNVPRARRRRPSRRRGRGRRRPPDGRRGGQAARFRAPAPGTSASRQAPSTRTGVHRRPHTGARRRRGRCTVRPLSPPASALRRPTRLRPPIAPLATPATSTGPRGARRRSTCQRRPDTEATPRFAEPAHAVARGGVLAALPMLLCEGLLGAANRLFRLPAIRPDHHPPVRRLRPASSSHPRPRPLPRGCKLRCCDGGTSVALTHAGRNGPTSSRARNCVCRPPSTQRPRRLLRSVKALEHDVVPHLVELGVVPEAAPDLTAPDAEVPALNHRVLPCSSVWPGAASPDHLAQELQGLGSAPLRYGPAGTSTSTVDLAEKPLLGPRHLERSPAPLQQLVAGDTCGSSCLHDLELRRLVNPVVIRRVRSPWQRPATASSRPARNSAGTAPRALRLTPRSSRTWSRTRPSCRGDSGQVGRLAHDCSWTSRRPGQDATPPMPTSSPACILRVQLLGLGNSRPASASLSRRSLSSDSGLS